MNIKKGDVLKHKKFPNNVDIVVMAIINELYFCSFWNVQNSGGTFYTLEGLKETFEIPEEKPKVLGYVIIEPGTEREEKVYYDKFTENPDGTVTIRAVNRLQA